MSRVTRIAFLCTLLLTAGAAGQGQEPRPTLAPGAAWFDDWYAVTPLDPRTFAIAEPRYEQQNVNYLILGDDRALLLDTGPGLHDIRRVAASLTALPITAVASHLHFDHVGGHPGFASVGSIDLPSIRQRTADNGEFTPSLLQHAAPGRPTWRITEWWKPDTEVDLGGRRLRVLSVPGHTPESLALYDREGRALFTGDTLYAGELFAFGPGSDLPAYRESIRRLLALTADAPDVAIYGAHVATPSRSPRLGRGALERTAAALGQLVDGTAGDWRLTRFSALPLRRYDFGDGLVILTPLW